ncbi:MAG: hypothetical protein ACK5LN_02830 [Propioniciclava sp.]
MSSTHPLKRRTLVTGAAWATPAVVATAAAPVMAASRSGRCVHPALGSDKPGPRTSGSVRGGTGGDGWKGINTDSTLRYWIWADNEASGGGLDQYHTTELIFQYSRVTPGAPLQLWASTLSNYGNQCRYKSYPVGVQICVNAAGAWEQAAWVVSRTNTDQDGGNTSHAMPTPPGVSGPALGPATPLHENCNDTRQGSPQGKRDIAYNFTPVASAFQVRYVIYRTSRLRNRYTQGPRGIRQGDNGGFLRPANHMANDDLGITPPTVVCL